METTKLPFERACNFFDCPTQIGQKLISERLYGKLKRIRCECALEERTKKVNNNPVFRQEGAHAMPCPECGMKQVGLNPPVKKIRRINPLGFRVVLSILDENDMTEGGLYLPEGAKQNLSESVLAKVIEVASATDHDMDEEHNISGIPLGAIVLIAKNTGTRVPWDDKLRIVASKDVLAVVEEVALV